MPEKPPDKKPGAIVVPFTPRTKRELGSPIKIVEDTIIFRPDFLTNPRQPAQETLDEWSRATYEFERLKHELRLKINWREGDSFIISSIDRYKIYMSILNFFEDMKSSKKTESYIASDITITNCPDTKNNKRNWNIEISPKKPEKSFWNKFSLKNEIDTPSKELIVESTKDADPKHDSN